MAGFMERAKGIEDFEPGTFQRVKVVVEDD
jgi:hypothetical protein